MESAPAPPGRPDGDGVDDRDRREPGPRCPWCGSARVERLAAFAAQLMSEQYMCLGCKSPFERIRK